MDASLETTNVMLGVMAAVSVLEALVLIGIGVGAFIAYRRVTSLLDSVREQQIDPVVRRVHAVLDDVKDVSETLRAETHRVDEAIRSTVTRVDETAQRVSSNLRTKSRYVVGAMRGARVALETILRPWESPGGRAA